MNFTLTPRLKECCQYIKPGDRIADIGCDHGYLAVYLLKNHMVSSVIAADIHEGPLQSAVLNSSRYGVREHMSFYLSDGLKSVPRDFSCIVCAGMGAQTIISILDAAPWLRSPNYRMVLQCQTKNCLLRRYLSQTGWYIHQESIVRDGRFLYTVMSVVWDPGHPLTPGETYFSPALLSTRSPYLPEHYRRIVKGLQQAVEGRGRQNVPYMAAACDELLSDPTFCWMKEDLHDYCK